MPKRHPNRAPFSCRSRTVQKRAYWQVLSNIRRAGPVLGGRFYTHHYMHGQNGWIDGYFLGVEKPDFFNFVLATTPYAYKEMVESRAWDLSYEVTPVDLDLSIFERTVKDPASGLYVTPPHVPFCYPELDGLTRYEWTRTQHQRIADSLEIKVFERWTLHHDYSHGIGLHATIDVPFLTTETVNRFIDRFLKSEGEFTSQEPRSFGFNEIVNWGIEPNQIAQPWEWGSGEQA